MAGNEFQKLVGEMEKKLKSAKKAEKELKTKVDRANSAILLKKEEIEAFKEKLKTTTEKVKNEKLKKNELFKRLESANSISSDLKDVFVF